jgi:hypothetical protein
MCPISLLYNKGLHEINVSVVQNDDDDFISVSFEFIFTELLMTTLNVPYHFIRDAVMD